jgi:hypothetical protein
MFKLGTLKSTEHKHKYVSIVAKNNYKVLFGEKKENKAWVI